MPECTFGGVRTYDWRCPDLLSEVSVVIIGGVRREREGDGGRERERERETEREYSLLRGPKSLQRASERVIDKNLVARGVCVGGSWDGLGPRVAFRGCSWVSEGVPKGVQKGPTKIR